MSKCYPIGALQEEERIASELAMMPPEMREAIETATRAGRVCVFNPATGQLIFDERAPLDSLSSIDAWLVEHPGYLLFFKYSFYYTHTCSFCRLRRSHLLLYLFPSWEVKRMPSVPQDLLDDHSSDEEEVDFQYKIYKYEYTVAKI